MKKLLPFSPGPPPRDSVADDPDGPDRDADRPAALVVGQTDAERVDEHVLTLRRFTELALRAAERMHAREEARAEAADAVPQETTEPAPTDGEVSVSLARLSRIARLDILLEQKLVEDLRNPEPRRRAAPSARRGRRRSRPSRRRCWPSGGPRSSTWSRIVRRPTRISTASATTS